MRVQRANAYYNNTANKSLSSAQTLVANRVCCLGSRPDVLRMTIQFLIQL